MKKLVSILLMLVLCASVMTSCTSCKLFPAPAGTFDPFNAFNSEVTPTTIKTVVDYVFVDADGKTQNLKGLYETVIEGDKSEMSFSYQRLATVEDMLADGRIVTVSGKIYKDGDRVSVDGDNWEDGKALPGSNFTLKLEESYFSSYTVDDDKDVLTGVLAPGKVAAALGVDLQAQGDVNLVVTGNGELVTGMEVSYTSLTGATVLIRTSYTYGAIESTLKGTDVEKIAAMYAISVPTKAVVSTEQNFGAYKLEGESTLLVGTYNGKDAAVFTYVYQELTDIENFNSTAKRSVQGSKEYFEGVGVRVDAINNAYAYFENGGNFAPKAGSIALNLQADLLTDVSYVDHVFTATVSAKNAKAVFGEDTTIKTTTKITIVDAGNLIESVTLVYTIPSITAAPDVTVTVQAVYSYNVETITPIIPVG